MSNKIVKTNEFVATKEPAGFEAEKYDNFEETDAV